MRTATRPRTIRRDPESQRLEDAHLEIDALQADFRLKRELGIYDSPYPQVGFCRVLGCQVREVRAKDMIR